jgi:hypothetical protein
MSMPSFGPIRAQRGASMLFALMTLVVLALAAVALIRSIDNSTLVAGNLGFKQDATAASARATEMALTLLTPLALASGLDADLPNQGYYASSLDNLDATGGTTTAVKPLAVIDWLGNGCSDVPIANQSACIQPAPEVSVPNSSVKVRWVITRLCAGAGPVQAGNPCARPQTTSTSSASERGDLSTGRIDVSIATPYYRVIVRAQGGRNSVSYTESIVHF